MNKRTLTRQYRVMHLHTLGPRPVFEALLEVEAGRPLDDVLKRYGRLDREVCRRLGADRLPIAVPHHD